MPVTGNKSLLSYSLSIRLCTDGFSFLVHSLGSGQLLLRESLRCGADETLEETLERGLLLPRICGRQYERVTLYSTSPATRIPLDEFRRDDMLAVYRLTFAGVSARPEDMRFQVLPALDVVEIFTMPASVADVMRRYYPSAMVQGLYGTMLCQVAEMQQGSTLPVSFHAMMLDGGIMIAVLRRGHLHFANVFRAAGNADRLYFMLYVWKTLALDAWRDSCTLYGADKDLYGEVCQYLAHVDMRDLNI